MKKTDLADINPRIRGDKAIYRINGVRVVLNVEVAARLEESIHVKRDFLAHTSKEIACGKRAKNLAFDWTERPLAESEARVNIRAAIAKRRRAKRKAAAK